MATASSVELASACVMNAVVRGKRLPGLSESPLHPARKRPLGGGAAGVAEEGRGSVEERYEDGGRGEGGEGEEEEEEEEEQEQEKEGGCVFEAALSVAVRQHAAFPHPVSNVWAAGVMVLLHEWMVNRGEFRAAEG